jgi:hypothetical protein
MKEKSENKKRVVKLKDPCQAKMTDGRRPR